MPTGLMYWLLYGNTGLTTSAANMTHLPPIFFSGPGDGVVTSWSQTGFQVTNYVSGANEEGKLIRSFDPSQGAEAPRERIALPYRHDGFLGNAASIILELLN